MPPKSRLVGMNHIALEVGDVDAALAFWEAIFDFEIRGRGDGHVFLDMGDQFIGLMQSDRPHRDETRHFGLVVDDRSGVLDRAREAGAEIMESGNMDFRDPWGNFIQVVDYRDLQFTKTDAVLRGMGLDLDKTDDAMDQLRKKGMA